MALVFSLVIWRPHLLRPGYLPVAIVGSMAVAGASLLVMRSNRALARVLDRFTFEGEFRLELWKDTLPAIAAHWPMGSGMGTFRSAFLPFERLEVVDQTWPVRAHNDYLELLLEAGLPGALALIVIVAIVVKLGVSAWRGRSGDRALVFFAFAALTIVGLHAILDYPLRSMALAHLTAIAVGLLAAVNRKGSAGTTETEMADA